MMKRILNLIAILALPFCMAILSGCSSEEGKLTAQMAQLEKDLAQSPNAPLADSLIAICQQWMALHTNDPARQAEGMQRQAAALAKTGRAAQAMTQLKALLQKYHDAPAAPAAALTLANLYKEQLGSTSAAYAIYQLMPEAFPKSDNLAEAEKLLPGKLLPLSQRIDSMATRIVNPETGQLDARTANDYIQSCELSALLLPQSPNAAQMLYKAGEVSRAAGAFDKALLYYEQVGSQYPEHDRASEALFMRAFTLDNDLKRYEEAKVLYEEFLQKYPKDDFADDAQFLMQNLGKSEEELFKALENR